MGIARFFAWIYKTYPDVLVAMKKGCNFQTEGLQVDTYSLDVNAIIHPVCQKMFGYGNDNKFGGNKRMMHREHHVKKTPTEEQVFRKICEKIEELRLLVNPKREFIIAIDGVAGLSKSVQQRGRRFKAAKERENKPQDENSFDSNSITTGTEFMFNFSKYLHFYIQRQMKTNWKHLKVVYSNEKVIGEGEHKIIRYIDKMKHMSHCIHSPDADLIMLTMGLDNPNVCIVRENIYRDIDCEYFVVDVNGFKFKMIDRMKWKHMSNVQNTQKQNDIQTVYDFILLCFLLGNDFLPHVPSLEISNEGLEFILETYPLVGSHLVYRKYFNDSVNSSNPSKKSQLCIDIKSFHRFCFLLSQKENDMLIRKSRMDVVEHDSTLMNSIIKPLDIVGSNDNSEINISLDSCKYKKLFYERLQKHACRSDVTPDEVVKEYIKGLLFVIRYYIDGIPDWHWFYPFHYAPMFSDLSVISFDGEMIFTPNEPLNSFEQLLAVLPSKSINLLPQSCQSLMKGNSEIIDFYPEKFEIDYEGKKMEWEGHPILPFVDVERLKKAYKSVESSLTENERKRIVNGRNTIYN